MSDYKNSEHLKELAIKLNGCYQGYLDKNSEKFKDLFELIFKIMVDDLSRGIKVSKYEVVTKVELYMVIQICLLAGLKYWYCNRSERIFFSIFPIDIEMIFKI